MRRMYERDGEEARALFARARAAGVATSLDLSLPDPASPSGRVDWRRWLDRVLPAVDFCVPSAEEVLFMLDPGEFSRRAAGPGGVAATLDRPRLRELAGALLERGAAAVLLKCGDQGAFLRVSGDAARLRAVGGGFPAAAADWAGFEGAEPCFAVEVAGTTGSGDCTIAGFLCGLLDGTGPREALVRAVAAGAASVERPDATSGVPRWEDLARRLAAGWTSRPSRLL
jgi:sugar/nucleoside kinase (ribokinase family)